MAGETDPEKTREPGEDGVNAQRNATSNLPGRDEEKRGRGRTVESDTPNSTSTTTSTSTMAPLFATESGLGRLTSTIRRDGREFLDQPPPLPFNLREHKLSISIFTFLALAECCFVPVALYYGLSKGTDLRSGKFSTMSVLEPCQNHRRTDNHGLQA